MELIKELVRTCPVCGHLQGKVLHTQHFSLPDKSALPDVYDVVECTTCGFCFADTIASWNFKHIVNITRIRGYNGVNYMHGHKLLEIRTPREILEI